MRVRPSSFVFPARRGPASLNEALIAAAVLASVAASAAAQPQFLDATARLPTRLDATDAVALGDVDGDGDLDVAFGNHGQNRLYLNDGTGRFVDVTATHLPPDSDTTASLVMGDIDADGDLDLVVGNGGAFAISPAQQNRVCLNDGTGVFTNAPERFPLRLDRTSALGLGDLDGDGDLDLVAATRAQSRLYLNIGAAFNDFTATHLPAASAPSNDLALGDVDGDGDLDLLFANGEYYGTKVDWLYINDGAGRFTDVTAAQMPVDPFQSGSMAMGDVDQDGDNDFAIGGGVPAYDDYTVILLNNGRGTFASSPCIPHFGQTFATALSDVDEDNDLDLVLAERILENRFSRNRKRLLSERGSHQPAVP